VTLKSGIRELWRGIRTLDDALWISNLFDFFFQTLDLILYPNLTMASDVRLLVHMYQPLPCQRVLLLSFGFVCSVTSHHSPTTTATTGRGVLIPNNWYGFKTFLLC